MTAAEWIALAIGVPGVGLGWLTLRNSMRADARQEQSEAEKRANRLQDRIWQLEDQLREKHGDD